jgi:acetyl-CoA/propionyl-CoA carboxylase biotin carboxyl carrier protein
MAGPQELAVERDGQLVRFTWALDGDDVWVGRGGDAWRMTRIRPKIGSGGPAGMAGGEVTSPMPGKVVAVHVKQGDRVAVGQRLVSVEAMKMEHVVAAPVAGTVARLVVREGESVTLDQPLAAVEPDEAEL